MVDLENFNLCLVAVSNIEKASCKFSDAKSMVIRFNDNILKLQFRLTSADESSIFAKGELVLDGIFVKTQKTTHQTLLMNICDYGRKLLSSSKQVGQSLITQAKVNMAIEFLGKEPFKTNYNRSASVKSVSSAKSDMFKKKCDVRYSTKLKPLSGSRILKDSSQASEKLRISSSSSAIKPSTFRSAKTKSKINASTDDPAQVPKSASSTEIFGEAKFNESKYVDIDVIDSESNFNSSQLEGKSVFSYYSDEILSLSNKCEEELDLMIDSCLDSLSVFLNTDEESIELAKKFSNQEKLILSINECLSLKKEVHKVIERHLSKETDVLNLLDSFLSSIRNLKSKSSNLDKQIYKQTIKIQRLKKQTQANKMVKEDNENTSEIDVVEELIGRDSLFCRKFFNSEGYFNINQSASLKVIKLLKSILTQLLIKHIKLSEMTQLLGQEGQFILDYINNKFKIYPDSFGSDQALANSEASKGINNIAIANTNIAELPEENDSKIVAKEDASIPQAMDVSSNTKISKESATDKENRLDTSLNKFLIKHKYPINTFQKVLTPGSEEEYLFNGKRVIISEANDSMQIKYGNKFVSLISFLKLYEEK